MIQFLKIAFIAFVSILCAQGASVQNEESEQHVIEAASASHLKYITELQSDYLNVEQSLWSRIDSIANDANANEVQRNETTAEIFRMHHIVFFGKTHETSSYWRSYLIFGITDLRDHLSAINNTLEENYGYLFDPATEHIVYDSSKIEQWTREAMFRRLKENADGLFDITERKDRVLQHIQNEAKCCTKYVTYVVSEVQLVREYYANVAKALLRCYAMTQLAYMLMTLSAQRNLRSESQVERRFYTERYGRFRESIERMLKGASRDLWKCNPNPYFDSHNYYTSITNFMQGYIDNEINLNSEQSCSRSCGDYKQTKNYECKNDTLCAHNNFQKTKCSGDVFDCDVIDSDATACLVKDEIENRRYNYVKFKNGSIDGHDVMCFKAEQTELSSWSRWLITECSNCFCFCDEPGEKSDRYFSLRAVTSDIATNKIITGIALKKLNRVIQFVISERELFEYGRVNDTYRRRGHIWKKDNYPHLSAVDSQNGIDYHTLSREHRSINLDTISLPLHQVVTGVRFNLHNERLHLEIRATDFDYETGLLKNLENSVWLNNLNDNVERTKLSIVEPDAPTRTINIQERFDSINKYVELRPSDIKKDLAQVTVPYIESVLLEASEPRPLLGVGLYYKGEIGYGGFLAIKLIAYDDGQI